MPKGVTDARKEKGASGNEVESKKRRSHDPIRGLESLPASRYFTNEKFGLATLQNAKNLLTVLYSMSNSEKTFRPVVTNITDLTAWGKTLKVENGGFLIISLTGATGTGKCISRGDYYGNPFHITSGGKTYSNKRGAHLYLCGTTSNNAAHIIADLSDSSVNTIVPILESMKIINLNEEKNDKKKDDDDDGINFSEADVKGNSYLVLIEAGKMINPKVTFKRPKNLVIKKKEGASKKTKIVETSYLEGMDLPDYDVPAGAVQQSTKNLNNSIADWNGPIEDEEEYESDSDEEDTKNTKKDDSDEEDEDEDDDE
jgi:hypothetical protein